MTSEHRTSLRTRLSAELQHLNQEARITMVENCADEADLAEQFNQRRIDMALSERRKKRRDELERALRRLDFEDYGICEECGGPIGTARLAARPTATLCVACQEELERTLQACA